MNLRESKIYESLLSYHGTTVYRRGWPDFLVVRNGTVSCVEVKSKSDSPSEEQLQIHKALESCGINVNLVVCDLEKNSEGYQFSKVFVSNFKMCVGSNALCSVCGDELAWNENLKTYRHIKTKLNGKEYFEIKCF
jgi:hypothetical protein